VQPGKAGLNPTPIIPGKADRCLSFPLNATQVLKRALGIDTIPGAGNFDQLRGARRGRDDIRYHNRARRNV
jgi:hypothetical protein